MNSLKVFLLSFALIFVFGLTVLAQEAPTEVPEAVNLDEDIQPEDLGVSEPRLLPDSPFYFLKNWGRSIRCFLAFNPIAKAELKAKFSNEKLMELKKMIEEKKGPEALKKAAENYQQETKKIKEQVEKIKEKAKENPKVESFLDKFIHQQTLHLKLLDRLETQVPPEAFEKIKEARERHLERFNDVMLKLEDRKEVITEKLDKILEKQKGSGFKEFKNLEVLKNLDEKVPEEAKEAIQKAQEDALKRLQRDLEKMSPKDQERFEEYLEKISGEKEKHLEILENLKSEIKEVPETPQILELQEKLEEGKAKMMEKIKERLEKLNCPVWKPPAPGFCKEGRIIIEKDPETGCPLPPKCIIPSEIEIPFKCKPICNAIGTRSEGWYDSCTKRRIRWESCEGCEAICKAVGTRSEGWYDSCTDELIRYGKCEVVRPERPEVCITLWDPVCGKDGKTYSNACFAKMAGVEIDYKGKCKEKECLTDADCPQLRCGPAGVRCIGVKSKCIEGKCVIVAVEIPQPPQVCIQVITPAMSPEGVCKEFPTPCDVPEGWKKVDRCPEEVPPIPILPIEELANLCEEKGGKVLEKCQLPDGIFLPYEELGGKSCQEAGGADVATCQLPTGEVIPLEELK